jgi:ATP-binding cassette, subfamily B, bacterial
VSEEQNKGSGLRLLPKLLGIALRTHPLGAVGLGGIALLGSLLPAVELWLTQQVIDELAQVLGSGSAGFWRVLPWVAGFFATLLAFVLLEMARAVLQVDVQEKIGLRLQRLVIDKVRAVELVHFEDPAFYDALKRANEDMSGRLLSLLNVLLNVLSAAGGLGAILAVLLTGHWVLAPLVMIGSVPGVWVMMRMSKKTHWVYRERTPAYRDLRYLRELLSERQQAVELRLFTLRAHLLGEWREKIITLVRERRGLEVKQAWLGGLGDSVGGWSYTGCMAILAWMVAGSTLTIGQYGMLTRAVQQFSWRLEQIMRSLGTLHEEALYLGDLFEFLERIAPEEPPSNGEDVVIPANLPLRFENVFFRYPSAEQDVLKGVSLELKAGERIALVGENGAGKTTLVKLMMGLYRPTSGTIFLGDKPLEEWPKEAVRRQFAAVFQDFVRYQFSVRENIAFGALDGATDGEIERAAQLAGVAEYAQKMPAGYDQLLGKELGGEDLSTGQWQKLATARALVRGAEVVVLDEPTAALDPKAEAEIYERFGEMTRGKSSVLISHRLGSARTCERILVLKDGLVVEDGSHDELMGRDGEYSHLFRLQAQWYE